MTIKYVGESKKGKEDRFALVAAKLKEENRVIDILNAMECKYDGFGDYEISFFYIPIESKEEFNSFSKLFRQTRKEIK